MYAIEIITFKIPLVDRNIFIAKVLFNCIYSINYVHCLYLQTLLIYLYINMIGF